MRYIISSKVKYRSERFGGIAESCNVGLTVFTHEEFEKFLSFEIPLVKTEDDFINDPLLEQFLKLGLIEEDVSSCL